MKRIKHFKTMMCIVLMTMALVVLWTIPKDAKADTNGSITINLKELTNSKGQITVRENVGFNAWRIGSWNGTEGKWELDKALGDTGVDLDDLTSETATANDLEVASKTLLESAELENVPKYEGQTDENGTLKFENLDWGVYLISQTSGEEQYGTISPLMVTVPYFTVENGTTVRTADIQIEPKAQPPIIYEAGQITVTKRTGYMDPELLEVVELIPSNATYYVGIFKDADGNVPYGKDYVKAISMQGEGTGTVTFDKLEKGTYYIFETDKNGKPYKVGDVQPADASNPYTWVCNLEEGSNQIVTIDGKEETAPGKVGLYNLYYDLPEGYFYEGTITVGKKVLNKKGNQTNVDDTFYAGIFRDAEGKDLYQVVELVQNGTVTVNVPLGGTTGQDAITYYIYETDKDGNRLNKNDFAYKISGEGKVNVEQGKLKANISLTNQKKDTSTKGSDDSNTSKKTSSKKTGDNTPIAFYLVIFAAAIAVLVFMARSRSMKGRNKHE